MALRNEFLRREVMPFAAMTVVVCSEIVISTLAKAALNAGLSSLIYIVYYNFIGILFLLPGFIIQRHRHPQPPLSLSILSRCFVLGMLGTCLVSVLGFQGLNYSSPTLAAGISNLMPGFTFVLAIIFRMEKCELKKAYWQAKSAGTFLSIIGASVMTLYQGPKILGSSISPSELTQRFLLLRSSNWVLGGALLLAAYLFASGWNILQTAILKDYPEQITVVFFSVVFGSFQCASVSLLVERNPDAWKLQPGIGITAILLSAVLDPLCNRNLTAFCLDKKGPLYVAMFKPLGIVIAAILNIVFLSDSLHLGSVIGSIIIVVGFYAVLWGMSKDKVVIEHEDILCEYGALDVTSPLLQK